MADIEISVESGTSKRLLTAGKYCDKNILVSASGGAATPVIEPLEVTTNGTYTAPAGVDGYNPVTVNVSESSGEAGGNVYFNFVGFYVCIAIYTDGTAKTHRIYADGNISEGDTLSNVLYLIFIFAQGSRFPSLSGSKEILSTDAYNGNVSQIFKIKGSCTVNEEF